MDKKVPIETLHLFPMLDERLIRLLRSLSAGDWNKPTLARLWTVKDVAAHLLDSNLRTLSLSRDGHKLDSPGINSYIDLVNYLNDLNASWVTAAKRLSPVMITDLLETTGKACHEHLASLDPFADAVFPVSWAGEERSYNWFHIAREYTEKWHHQQQIREAVAANDALMERSFFYPFINTLVRGLPHAYRNTAADEGTVVNINISGPAGGSWFLVREQAGWVLTKTSSNPVAATVTLPPGTAWKVFTKAITPGEAKQTAVIEADESLAMVALGMIAVMA